MSRLNELVQKLFGPVGPVFTVDEKIADLLAKLRMAVEED